MAEEQMKRAETHKQQQDEVLADKRVFLRRAVAALGVVTAAGLTGRAITRSAVKTGDLNARSRSAEEVLQHRQIMTGKKLEIMTQEEKRQMLDRILRNHHRTVS